MWLILDYLFLLCFRIEPRYQELLKEDIPNAESNGVEVKVIAGESMGVHSPVYTQTPTMYLDFTLKQSSHYHQTIPESWNAFVYIIEGEGIFGIPNSPAVSAHHILVLGPGEGLSVWNKSTKPLRFILVGGEPLNEPVVQHGPFVMNTQAQIDKTIEDYYYGKNGFELARQWRSKWNGEWVKIYNFRPHTPIWMCVFLCLVYFTGCSIW